MIERTAKEAVLRLASQFPVVGITGPRQSGKSTLAKMAFPQKKYVTLDDRAMQELAKANPMDFLLAFPNGAIIDEVQKVPELFDAIKYYVDNEEFVPGKYILTGSNQFNLKQNMTDSLAGRVAFIKLMPLSLGELRNVDLLEKNAYENILKGCYPPLFDNEKHFLPEDWFTSYIDTYLDLDVEKQINYSNLSEFKKFIQICAIYSGQMISMDNIARNVGVSAPTIKQWLSILESSYIIHFLHPDSNNLGKTLVKSPKLYFCDSGLLCHLLRIESVEELLLSQYKGAIVETFAVNEMMKSRLNKGKNANLTFFRDNKGFEIDTIADWKHSFAIEIKSTIEADKKLSKNLQQYLSLCESDGCKGAVFYLGELTCRINGIDYVSWRDWPDFTE